MEWTKSKKINELISDKRRLLAYILLLGILMLGNSLREYSYASVPHPGETTDEYSYGWNGLNLLQTGTPTSWSSLPSYKTSSLEKINVDSIFDHDPSRPLFPIVTPWTDHPPLFGIVTGGYAYLKGARTYTDASVALLRLPMIKIALITTVLIFMLASMLYGRKVGLLSAFIYSVAPTYVISSRLALIENGMIPLFLGSLVAALFYFKTLKFRYWVLACILSYFAMLFKLSSISICFSLVALALYFGKHNKRLLISTAVLSVGFALATFTLYGVYIGWDTFTKVFFSNAGRFYGAGSEIILQAVNQMRLTTSKFLTDGWLLIGWVSAFILMVTQFRKSKGATVLTTALVSYLTVFILFGSESYGWYKYPLFPFLIIASAKVLKDLYDSYNVFPFILLLFLPFGSSLHRLIGIMEFQSLVPAMRTFSIAMFVLFGLALIRKKDSLKINILLQSAMLIMFLVIAYLSIKEIYFYNFDTWFKAT